jgi:hypothetical protein
VLFDLQFAAPGVPPAGCREAAGEGEALPSGKDLQVHRAQRRKTEMRMARRRREAARQS